MFKHFWLFKKHFFGSHEPWWTGVKVPIRFCILYLQMSKTNNIKWWDKTILVVIPYGSLSDKIYALLCTRRRLYTRWIKLFLPFLDVWDANLLFHSRHSKSFWIPSVPTGNEKTIFSDKQLLSMIPPSFN